MTPHPPSATPATRRSLTAKALRVIQRTADQRGNVTMLRLAENIAAEMTEEVREAMAQAWERGNNDGLTFAAAPQKSLLTNPYRATTRPNLDGGAA